MPYSSTGARGEVEPFTVLEWRVWSRDWGELLRLLPRMESEALPIKLSKFDVQMCKFSSVLAQMNTLEVSVITPYVRQ